MSDFKPGEVIERLGARCTVLDPPRTSHGKLRMRGPRGGYSTSWWTREFLREHPGVAKEARGEFVYGDGLVLKNVHPPGDCDGTPCVIHNPSEHHMREWPLRWRGFRLIFERICPHGIGHPDPDSLYYEERDLPPEHVGLHGCDGCCKETK